jgi:hypothetical protein
VKQRHHTYYLYRNSVKELNNIKFSDERILIQSLTFLHYSSSRRFRGLTLFPSPGKEPAQLRPMSTTKSLSPNTRANATRNMNQTKQEPSDTVKIQILKSHTHKALLLRPYIRSEFRTLKMEAACASETSTARLTSSRLCDGLLGCRGHR